MADDPALKATGFAEGSGASHIRFRKDEAVTDPEVGGVPEIPFLNIALGLQPGEEIWAWPAVWINLGSESFW